MSNVFFELRGILSKLYSLPIVDVFDDNVERNKCTLYLSVDDTKLLQRGEESSYYITGELIIRASKTCKLERTFFLEKWELYQRGGMGYARGFTPNLTEIYSTIDSVNLPFNYFSKKQNYCNNAGEIKEVKISLFTDFWNILTRKKNA